MAFPFIAWLERAGRNAVFWLYKEDIGNMKLSDTVGKVPDLFKLANECAINQILAMYCRGVDRADEAALRDCYWPEAVVRYGAEWSPAHEFCVHLVPAIRNYAQTHHSISNVLIDFSDGPKPESAKVESYVTAKHYLKTEAAGESEMTYLGRYLDQFEKRGAYWKIISRIPVMSWSQNAVAVNDIRHPALSALTKAGRFPDDPIYS
jgi:hypothetical protein